MKRSIRTKITFMVVVFATFIVAMAWLICNYLITGVFMMHLKKNLETTYDSCNELFNQKAMIDQDTGALMGGIQNPLDAIVFIFDDENERVYTTVGNNSRMMKSMNDMIDTILESDHLEQYLPGHFIIQKTHDIVINADYYDLIGTLDNGFTIILRSPIARIELTMHIVNKIFVYVAIGLIIFGSIFTLIFSNIFSAPLKRLSHAARRMSNLDFDVKIPVQTKDEIGELGVSMNVMSDRLERTITQLKSANIRLEKDIEKKKQIDEMRKEFLSHVSHELKTPIAIIQGYAEGLKENLFDDPESKEFYTDVIIDEAQKMNDMVKKLLELNELEFGENPITVKRFELTQMIEDILTASKILIDDVGAVVEFHEQPIYVWADEFMIEEVVTNYLTNAVHYVKEGGMIRISYSTVASNLRVSVYNQGPQIADEDIDKLFVKFYKSDKARTREYGGNGIGLSIVAAVMEAHAKSYGVYNVSDGVVFYFDLDANLSANLLDDTSI
ncbi:MAG: HAMP domain-containing sensor histidine kinase [Eubacteriales bacterium]|nr:HAMP domain-containing sensor histidine kinase [Eubacteriales bacterium]